MNISIQEGNLILFKRKKKIVLDLCIFGKAEVVFYS